MAQLFSTRLLIEKKDGMSFATGIDLWHTGLAFDNYGAIAVFIYGVNNQVVFDIIHGIKPLERTGPAPAEYFEKFNQGTRLVAPTKPYYLEVPIGYQDNIILKITEVREAQQ